MRLEKYLKERERMRSETEAILGLLQSINDKLDRLLIMADEERLEGLKSTENAEIFDHMMGTPLEELEDLFRD